MTNNFFKLLTKLDSEFLQKYSSLPASGKQTIKRLIMYVESGNWTKSEVTKLYCKNWNKSYDQLRLIFREEGFKDRGEVTIRSQISELSRNLCEVFGNCSEIMDAFNATSGKNVEGVTKTQGEKFITNLSLKLQVLQGYKDESFTKRLAINPYDFGISSYPEQSYQISDCAKELALLKTLSVETIQSLYEEIDADKLAFLLQALNKPLLISERSEKQKKDSDSTYKVNRLSVNTAKIDILQALELTAPKKIKPVGFENSEVNEESLSVNEMEEVAEDFTSAVNMSGVETSEELPFRFATMNELCDVVQEKLQSSSLTTDIEKRARNISNLKQLFSFFTEDGLRSFLMKYAGGDVAEAIRSYRKE